MPVQGRSRGFAEGRCEEVSMEQRSATGGDHFVEDTYLAPQAATVTANNRWTPQRAHFQRYSHRPWPCPAQAPHGCAETFRHLLPEDWILTNLQQVQQRSGRDAFGAAVDRAGDGTEDAVPLVRFEHDVRGPFVGTGEGLAVSPIISNLSMARGGGTHRERPRGCSATHHRDELAAFHSITSSARASSVAGTSRPSGRRTGWIAVGKAVH